MELTNARPGHSERGEGPFTKVINLERRTNHQTHSHYVASGIFIFDKTHPALRPTSLSQNIIIITQKIIIVISTTTTLHSLR